MRVTLVTRAPFLGGAEVACERLGAGLRDAGHQVVVVTGEDGEVSERLRAAALEVRHLATPLRDKWRLGRYLLARSRLRTFFRSWRPDVIHSNDLPTHQIVSSAAHRLGIPRVCHHRFLYEQPSIDWMNNRGAERHLFVSRYLRDHFCAASPKIAAQGCQVVYDGLPMPVCPTAADRVEARRELNLPLDRVVVLFTGQVIAAKGVAVLLEAWRQLGDETVSRGCLVIAGDDLQSQGAYRKEMEALSRSLGVAARFVGFRRDVPRWLTAADVAVVPSLIEPLGNATLEAMSYGLPVIGSRTGGIPEMIVDGVTGRLSPPGDAAALAAVLAELIIDERKRRSCGAAGRTRCEQVFSLESHVNTVLSAYAFARSGAAPQSTTAQPEA